MPKKKTDIDVASGFTELDRIAEWFEAGEADLEQGMKKFERAMEISAALKAKLQAAENTITEIKHKFS